MLSRVPHAHAIHRCHEYAREENERTPGRLALRPAAQRSIAEHSPFRVRGEVVHDRFAVAAAVLRVEHGLSMRMRQKPGNQERDRGLKGTPLRGVRGVHTGRWWQRAERAGTVVLLQNTGRSGQASMITVALIIPTRKCGTNFSAHRRGYGNSEMWSYYRVL